MPKQSEKDMIEFVRKTTEAITVMAEATKQNAETSGAIKDLVVAQSTANAVAFKEMGGRMDNLLTMFKYVIAPLIAGIIGLVGAKMIFKF